MATPLQTNTDKLTALKEKANNLPDQNPPAQLQEKTVTPTKEGLSVAPDSGFDGLSKVTVNGDNNLVPENIKEGVSIFGVDGNHKGRAEWIFLHSTRSTLGIQPMVSDPSIGVYSDIIADTLPVVILLKEFYLNSHYSYCGMRIDEDGNYEYGFYHDVNGTPKISSCDVTENNGKYNLRVRYSMKDMADVYYMLLPGE